MPRPDRPYSPHQTTAKPKLLDQVRGVLRRKHYSIRTEQSYVDWIKRFILFNLFRVNSPPLAAHRFAVGFGFDTPSLAASRSAKVLKQKALRGYKAQPTRVSLAVTFQWKSFVRKWPAILTGMRVFIFPSTPLRNG